jgi:1-acyl-sn-glycerol-3-phosphate acyltransferase
LSSKAKGTSTFQTGLDGFVMLTRMITHVRACLVTTVIAAHTLFWGTPIHLLALVKFCAPTAAWKAACTAGLIRLVKGWIKGVLFIQDRFLNIAWDIRTTAELSRRQWYMVTINHRSWADIPVLLKALTGRVPFPVVFAKQQMFWVPVIGTAIWAMDYPIMKRYSRRTLAAHPEKRGIDLETTRQSCRRYQFRPVAIWNFIEGTRFTPAKHRRQRSPYRHLLRPKAGGLALAMQAMEGRITRLLDVTIAYPAGLTNFWAYLGGQVKRVTVHLREIAVPEPMLAGSYSDDHHFRKSFQAWLDQIWQEKDALLDRLLKESAAQAKAPSE